MPRFRPPRAPGPPARLECLCEVRLEGAMIARFGPFGDVLDATLEMARSQFPLHLADAEFVVLKADDRSLICVSSARELLALRALDDEQRRLH